VEAGKWGIHYTLLLAMFNPLRSSTNQELFEKHFCNESSHYEKCEWFPFWREVHHVLLPDWHLTNFVSLIMLWLYNYVHTYYFPLTQRRSGNIQHLIQSAGLDSLSTDQISLQPHKGKGSLKRATSTGTTASKTEVSNLNSEDFMEWLMIRGYSIQDCEAFRGRCKTVTFKHQI